LNEGDDSKTSGQPHAKKNAIIKIEVGRDYPDLSFSFAPFI